MARESSQTFTESADAVRSRVDQQMEQFLGHSALSVRQKTALGCRILAKAGHAQTLAGQVTVRAEEGGYWTTNFAAGLGEATAGNLVRFDREMRITKGEGMANPAVRFHLWIYERRPDVGSVVHTHPPHASALSMIGEPLRVAHMDAMMLHDACAYLPHWPGVPLANEEGEIISAALGERSAILLAHHGLLTAAATVESAVYLAMALEHAARLQLLASSCSTIRTPPAALAAEARAFLMKPSFVNATFNYWARQVIREDSSVLA